MKHQKAEVVVEGKGNKKTVEKERLRSDLEMQVSKEFGESKKKAQEELKLKVKLDDVEQKKCDKEEELRKKQEECTRKTERAKPESSSYDRKAGSRRRRHSSSSTSSSSTTSSSSSKVSDVNRRSKRQRVHSRSPVASRKK